MTAHDRVIQQMKELLKLKDHRIAQLEQENLTLRNDLRQRLNAALALMLGNQESK